MDEEQPRGFPPAPRYDLANGILVVETLPPPARRIIPLTYEHQGGVTDDALLDVIVEALAAVADEASEASTEHYEADAALEDDVVRIWFGVVPANSPPRRWRDLVVELAPIQLAAIRR